MHILRREIGIRLAGATPAAVRRLIIQRGVVVGSMGAAAGLFASFAVARLVERRLSRITAVDPVWRALRLDPAITLRQE